MSMPSRVMPFLGVVTDYGVLYFSTVCLIKIKSFSGAVANSIEWIFLTCSSFVTFIYFLGIDFCIFVVKDCYIGGFSDGH